MVLFTKSWIPFNYKYNEFQRTRLYMPKTTYHETWPGRASLAWPRLKVGQHGRNFGPQKWTPNKITDVCFL